MGISATIAIHDMVQKDMAYDLVVDRGALPLLQALNAEAIVRYDEIWMDCNRNAS